MLNPISAISVGEIALRSRSVLQQGRILAVFKSTVWCEFPNGAVCVTLSGIAPGPVNIVTDLSSGDWRSTGLQVGQRVLFSPNTIRLGALQIDPTRAQPWSPKPFCVERMQQGVDFLRRNRARRGDTFRGCQADHFQDVLTDAHDWCVGKSQGMTWAARLIGRGIGLTPAGDDFLGGMLVALQGLGRVEKAKRLWDAIHKQAAAETNKISFTLLSAAAEGLGSAVLHDALNAIGRGASPEAYVAGIDALGHSSGWDALAGAVTVLEAELANCAA